ncbi:fibronectin type III domain-containing protein [Krasilnikovia sp. MM14-A1259]|uniref:fibronectin type III domain-containing protein n=1 Tax=Krasilnikovia sp. MM14-A1259 TaxID=3373539 RepID=UPI00399CD218
MIRPTFAVCALLTLAAGGCASTAGTGQDVATPATPAAQSWIVVATGATPTASPAPTTRTTPTASPAVPSASASATPTPTASASHAYATCVGAHKAGQITVADVQPGRTSAVVRWNNPGDESVVAYRVTAISQDLVGGSQPQLPWTVVDPGHGCHTVTATVPGLQPHTRYVFPVNAIRTALSQDGTTQSLTVARSRVVTTG